MTRRLFLEDFYDRRRDVRRYLAVVMKAENAFSGDSLRLRHDRELRMFRAGALLVLYNAIEASARSGIQAIYDEIEETQTPFDHLRASFRKRVIRDFKSNFGTEDYTSLRRVAYELVSASFDPEKLFGGNVDARELRSKSEDYGFATVTNFARTRNGVDLLTIKNRRNTLAHGLASFSDVGREYLASDIRRIGRYSMNYMQDILHHIALYLDEEGYKEVAA